MSIDFAKALGVHPQALQVRQERTRLLAANIANEDTPGYQARDLDFSAALRQAGEADAAGPQDSAEAMYRVPYHPSQDGNTVDLGVEQAAFAQNATDFQTSITFLNLQLKGLAKAIAGQ